MKLQLQKPANWSSLPLYEKVKIYGLQLTKDYGPYVDKIAVKSLVKQLCPQIKIPKVIRQLKGPTDIFLRDLNDSYLLKATHGSGWLIDLATNKDLYKIKETLLSWNKTYSQAEIQYTYLKPRYFLEEKIDCVYSGKTGNAHDIKVHCIHGEPYFLLFRKDQQLRNYYDINWNPIMPLEFNAEKPKNFDKILMYCRQLSKPFVYVRVDLYVGVDGIYFGEYTFTPHGGKQRLSTEVEKKYGLLWT